ncbi:glycoside hydrolase family 16 protein, partial [Athelia psychrophila]
HSRPKLPNLSSISVDLRVSRTWDTSASSTNQAATVGGTETNSAVGYGFDPTAAFHDTPGLTEYYVDGQIKASYTTNVPSVASSFILNNWSSGDPNWSAGPPTADNIVRIQSVTGYYA